MGIRATQHTFVAALFPSFDLPVRLTSSMFCFLFFFICFNLRRVSLAVMGLSGLKSFADVGGRIPLLADAGRAAGSSKLARLMEPLFMENAGEGDLMEDGRNKRGQQ